MVLALGKAYGILYMQSNVSLSWPPIIRSSQGELFFFKERLWAQFNLAPMTLAGATDSFPFQQKSHRSLNLKLSN